MYFMKFEKIINLDYTSITDKSENQISWNLLESEMYLLIENAYKILCMSGSSQKRKAITRPPVDWRTDVIVVLV